MPAAIRCGSGRGPAGLVGDAVMIRVQSQPQTCAQLAQHARHTEPQPQRRRSDALAREARIREYEQTIRTVLWGPHPVEGVEL